MFCFTKRKDEVLKILTMGNPDYQHQGHILDIFSSTDVYPKTNMEELLYVYTCKHASCDIKNTSHRRTWEEEEG
jgi:hypothetical protein